jgi:PEP-CTERM motif
MTEQAVFTLTPHGELLSRGQTEIKNAIPEPSTWAMMVFGFVGLAYLGFRKGRVRSAISFA